MICCQLEDSFRLTVLCALMCLQFASVADIEDEFEPAAGDVFLACDDSSESLAAQLPTEVNSSRVELPPPFTTDKTELDKLRRFRPLLELTPQQCWNDFGFCLIKPDTEMIELANYITELVTARKFDRMSKQSRLKRIQTIIAGGTIQTNVFTLRAKAVLESRELLRRILRHHWAQLNQLPHTVGNRFSGTKTLVSSYGRGEQMLHWDSSHFSIEHPDTTCIVFCTPCNSTLLPRFSTLQQLPKAGLPVGNAANASEMRERSFLLTETDANNKPAFFDSVPVESGTILFFRHYVPHAGVANDIPDSRRVLLFDMLAPSKSMPNANQQYFYWHYLREAYGESSQQFISAVLDNWHHDPTGRELPAEADRILELLRKYCNSLSKPQYFAILLETLDTFRAARTV